jgi:hypothetical protein
LQIEEAQKQQMEAEKQEFGRRGAALQLQISELTSESKSLAEQLAVRVEKMNQSEVHHKEALKAKSEKIAQIEGILTSCRQEQKELFDQFEAFRQDSAATECDLKIQLGKQSEELLGKAQVIESLNLESQRLSRELFISIGIRSQMETSHQEEIKLKWEQIEEQNTLIDVLTRDNNFLEEQLGNPLRKVDELERCLMEEAEKKQLEMAEQFALLEASRRDADFFSDQFTKSVQKMNMIEISLSEDISWKCGQIDEQRNMIELLTQNSEFIGEHLQKVLKSLDQLQVSMKSQLAQKLAEHELQSNLISELRNERSALLDKSGVTEKLIEELERKRKSDADQYVVEQHEQFEIAESLRGQRDVISSHLEIAISEKVDIEIKLREELAKKNEEFHNKDTINLLLSNEVGSLKKILADQKTEHLKKMEGLKNVRFSFDS